MLESFPIAVFAGLSLGYLAGLGVGGGSLLMLWLTVILKMDYGKARAVNLMFFLVSATAVSLLRWRKGTIKIKEILPAIIAGSMATAIATFISHSIDHDLIKKIFGLLLLVTGVKELLYRPRKAR